MPAQTKNIPWIAICGGILLCGLGWWWLGYEPCKDQADVSVMFINPYKYGSGIVYARDLELTRAMTWKEVEMITRREFAEKRPGLSDETFEVKGVSRWRTWSNGRAIARVVTGTQRGLDFLIPDATEEAWQPWIKEHVLGSYDRQWIKWEESLGDEPLRLGDQMTVMMK